MLVRPSHAGRKFQDAWAEAMAKCAVGVDQQFGAHSICRARPGILGGIVKVSDIGLPDHGAISCR